MGRWFIGARGGRSQFNFPHKVNEIEPAMKCWITDRNEESMDRKGKVADRDGSGADRTWE